MNRTLKIAAISLFTFVAPVSFAQAAEHTVNMVDDEMTNAFEPRKLTIKSGDTVTWVNTGDRKHDVMAESIPLNAEVFSSPMLKNAGDKWSYTFTKSGTYRYHCHPHERQGMMGTIIVDRPSKADEVKDVGDEHHHGDE